MSLWRLEWLRLVRTKRLVALVGAYLFFGLLGPFTARYLGEILDAFGGVEGATIELPPPVPVDGLAQYVSNATQLCLLVAVVIAAGALTFDAKPEIGIFLRTRVGRVADIIWPRYVVSSAGVSGAFVAGAVAAWYESVVLIGPLDTAGVLTGVGFGVLYLVFAVAVVAAASQRASSVLGAVIGSIVVLLVFPIAGIVDAIGRWLPSHLVGALTTLPAGASAGDYLGAAVVTALATPALLLLATRWAARREL